MIELSIIIPHYNAGLLLERLLSTIPDTEKIEVLVVDDKSNRNLEAYEKCRDIYCQKNVLFYKNTTDRKGAGVARNIGLQYAKGKWLTFMDADDYACANLEEIICKYCNREEDIIYFPPTSICIKTQEESDRHTHYMKLANSYYSNPIRENELQLRYNYYSPCSKFVKRTLVEKKHIRFSETLYSNDVMFSTKTGHYAQKIAAGNEIFYCITENEFGLTTQVNADSKRIRTEIQYQRMKFLIKRIPIKEFNIVGLCLDNIAYLICEHYGMKQQYEWLKNLRRKKG